MMKVAYFSNDPVASVISVEYMKRYGNIDYAVFDEIQTALDYIKNNPDALVLFEYEEGRVTDCNRAYTMLVRSGAGGRFVVITAEDNHDVISDIYKDGASAVLVKPYDYDAFCLVLKCYEENLVRIGADKINDGFWLPVFKIFPTKPEKLYEDLKNLLNDNDLTADELATGLKQSPFVIRRCLNELVLSGDVVSYVKETEGDSVKRYFAKRHL